MLTSYNIEVSETAIFANLERICNQIFKLLPMWEEEKDWEKPLETLIIELLGLSGLLPDQKESLSLICKLEGLKQSAKKNELDFFVFRRTIFECCSLTSKIKECL